jgi:O-antigen biosynthesis protein
MHQLSIVIVNYNVKHFLEQVLYSVEAASQHVDVETWVVDNNSVDGSMEMVHEKFPWVQTIVNRENLGFSKANNQAILRSNSKYILLLNPDTVLQEDTLLKCITYLDEHDDVGGLGVRMIDGKGQFLPESKRGLPTPKAAFYKMSGLASLFPKSREFGRYHLKYLAEHETHEVEVLAGAFMMLRNEVLQKIGLLDEQFFMYGEDIDLSYRITLAGYKNVYFSDTTIIHYKGESTKKKSVNYVKVFYHAMVLFAQKHYSPKTAGRFSFWIHSAIYLRALFAIIWRGASRVWVPGLDFFASYLGYFAIARYWEAYHKFVPDFYPTEYYVLHIPFYVAFVLIAIFISGGYDRPIRGYRIFRGALLGSIFLFALYAFFSKDMQFSRAILALGSAWTIGVTLWLRWIYERLGIAEMEISRVLQKRIVIVAAHEEGKRILDLLNHSKVPHEFLGWVHPQDFKGEGYIGNFEQLTEIVEIYGVNTIVFSSEDVSNSRIIEAMSVLSEWPVQLKIAPSQSSFIIGSDNKNEPGELFTLEISYSLTAPFNKRRKRIMDVMVSLVLLFGFPLFLWLCVSPKWRMLYRNLWSVLNSSKTWVSYDGLKSAEWLPKMKPGVFPASGNWTHTEFEADVNMVYAKEYEVSKDIHILFSHLKGFK